MPRNPTSRSQTTRKEMITSPHARIRRARTNPIPHAHETSYAMTRRTPATKTQTTRRRSALLNLVLRVTRSTARAHTIIASGPIMSAVLTAAASSSLLAGDMIRKLAGGKYRLYSRKKNPRTGQRRNLGTFSSRKAAQQHEREVEYFKRH